MDPNTGLEILGGAIGSAKLIEKILGPTAEYLGGGIKNWTERRVSNVGRIFDKAGKKLGDDIENEGTVPPKVLKGILEEGQFCEDELSAEYFGGVLASSRSDVSRDDRGATFTALLGRLSTYEIRAHFFFYNIIKSIFNGDRLSVTVPQNRAALEVFIPWVSYSVAMEFSEKEAFEPITQHLLFTLGRESLIEQTFQFGPVDYIQKHFSEATEPGLLIQPSLLGVELFLWAYGKGHIPPVEFLNPEVVLESETKLPTVPGFQRTRK